MPAITPTVGRSLHFFRSSGAEPWAAKVCKVNADGTVNLAFWSEDGVSGNEKGVRLIQPDDVDPEAGAFCRWMPFTVEQSKKVNDVKVAVESPAPESVTAPIPPTPHHPPKGKK